MENSIRYEIVFEGRLMPGFTAQSARENLTRTSILNPVTASCITFDGAQCVLYSNSSKRKAFSTFQKFQSAGLDCKVRKRTERPPLPADSRFSGMLKYFLLALLILMTAMAFSHLLDL